MRKKLITIICCFILIVFTSVHARRVTYQSSADIWFLRIYAVLIKENSSIYALPDTGSESLITIDEFIRVQLLDSTERGKSLL